MENRKTTLHYIKVAKIIHYFDVIVDALNIKRCEISKEQNDLIVNAIKTLEKHPIIFKIKELNSGSGFSFENVSLENVKKGKWKARSFPTPRYSK